jgi:hypothetical protein
MDGRTDMTKLIITLRTFANASKTKRLLVSICLVQTLRSSDLAASWHVTVLHRNKLLCNKTNQMHQFHKFILSWNSTCFGQFVCPSSGDYSLYIQQWYISYRFVDSLRAGPGWNCSSNLVLLESCTTYTIAEWTVNKRLILDRWNFRNM